MLTSILHLLPILHLITIFARGDPCEKWHMKFGPKKPDPYATWRWKSHVQLSSSLPEWVWARGAPQIFWTRYFCNCWNWFIQIV